MSEQQLVESTLTKTARRRRWERSLAGLWKGLFAGSLLWLLTLVLYKLLPLPVAVLSGSGLIGLLLIPAGFLFGGWRSDSLADTAIWVDQRQHLQERVSTAWELIRQPTASEWCRLLLGDAVQHLQSFNLSQVLPFRLPKVSRLALAALVLGFGLGFVPEYRTLSHIKKEEDRALITDVGRHLVELTRRNLESHPPTLLPVQKQLEAITDFAGQLTSAKLNRDEALRDLSSVTEKLKQELKQFAQNPAFKRLEQAARQPGGQGRSLSAARQKQIEDLQKSLGRASTNSEALNQLKENLQKAQAAANGLASKDSSAKSAERSELGQALSNLAQQAQDLGLDLPELQEAIQALASEKADLLVRDLQTAVKDLEKMQAMAQALQQLQQQAEKVGHNLGEQLEKAQAQAAIKTLETMINQLKAANLTPEQMKKILDEVAGAIEPAKEYGQVSEFLKQATQRLGQNQLASASQSLSEAAKELEKLLQEMGDLESLKASLASLQRAQMCLGEGQRWGQCKRIGMGKGGKPGKGFGTWAQEEGWLEYPEISDLWENPPDARGPMDARSATDRGDGQLSDSLSGTKIPGQISPGNSMPSVPLRGVSIKGLSNVKYQEAVLAAQQQAQSALNQDQIPRAYQGAVREYFDDVK